MTDTPIKFLNEIAAEVRAGLKLGAAREGQNPSFDLARSREFVEGVRSGRTVAGNLPPQPSTLRGRIGAFVIQMMRRSLFWYTAPLQSFQSSAAAAIEEQSQAFENSTHNLAEQHSKTWALCEELLRRISILERENHSLGEQVKLALEASRRAKEFFDRLVEVEDQLAKERSLRKNLARKLRSLEIPFPDSVYVQFEDLFRGPEAEIKDRLRVHVPRLQISGVGSPEMPLLDLGCGRGEWLGLLREHGYTATGIDSNSRMIAQCQEMGLSVQQADAFQHLRSLADESLGAITGFHIVEHLPMPVLTSLLAEVVRVLKPGGLVIFETPNPANLQVGASSFYLDPTHQKPIPSSLLKFLLENAGLQSVEVLALHPFPDDHHLDEMGNPAAGVINQHLFGCQDYAVIASKTPSPV